MNFTEKEIQDYIWENRASWDDFILPLSGYDLHDLNKIENISNPEKIFQNIILKKLKKLHVKSSCMEIFASEVPLIQSSSNTMRLDLLGKCIDDSGLCIIELKKSKKTERESFTELLAYTNYMSSMFPGFTKDDCLLVLVAPMETQIVKEAYIYSLLYDEKQVVAYTLDFDDNQNLKSLKLKPWIPTIRDIKNVSQHMFNSAILSVVKVGWENSEGVWNPAANEETKDFMIEQMNNISSQASQIMEKKGVHGFVYTSQVWPEFSEVLPLTNSLVIVAVNPFAVASEIECENSIENESILKLESIITGLKKSRGYEPDKYHRMYEMYSCWESNIFRIAFDVVNLCTKQTDGKETFMDSSSMSWRDYKNNFFEDVSCNNFCVRPTGVFRELYLEFLDCVYINEIMIDDFNEENNIMHLSVNTMNSHSSFRKFIDNLYYSDEVLESD